MNRDEARKAAEVMLAYADGKELDWAGYYKNCEPAFNWDNDADAYRIKPTLTYRPFANAEECWEEMQKHKPFGWVIRNERFLQIVGVNDSSITVCFNIGSVNWESFANIENFTFADGTPFGKLTEEE